MNGDRATRPAAVATLLIRVMIAMAIVMPCAAPGVAQAAEPVAQSAAQSVAKPAANSAAAPVAAPAAEPPAADQRWSLARLLGEMRERKEAHARFVERQFLSLLDGPVDASGELVFKAPDKLEKRTLKPRPELLAVDGDQLRIERGGLERTLSLSQLPEAAVLIESLRATLSGDPQALRKVFVVELGGTREHWRMVLTPSDRRAAAVVRSITLTGQGRDIATVEIQQTDGDHSVMRILDAD